RAMTSSITPTTSGGASRATTNRLSTKVFTSPSNLALGLLSEAAPIDAIAQGRTFDLQELGRPGLVASADLKSPANEARLNLTEAVVQRDPRRTRGYEWLRTRGRRRKVDGLLGGLFN